MNKFSYHRLLFQEFEKQRGLAIFWAYGWVIAINELVFTYGSQKLGILLHLLLLGALLVQCYFLVEEDKPWLYLTLALAPLVRILSISIPLAEIPLVFWYFMISVPLFTAGVLIKRLIGISFYEMGYTLNHLPMQVLLALVGVPLGLIQYQILKPTYINYILVRSDVWLCILILVICTGFLEEYIFRGIMFRAALEAVGENNAIFYVSFIYAVMQAPHGSLLNVLYVFLIAMLFTKVLIWQKSIIGISLAHGLINVTLYLICPLFFN